MCAKLFVAHTHGRLHTAEILRLNSSGGGWATSGRPAGLLSTWPSWGTADLWDYCWRGRFWTWWPGVHRVSSLISWYWRFGGCCNSAFAGGTLDQGRSPERAVTGITAGFLIHFEFFKFVKIQKFKIQISLQVRSWRSVSWPIKGLTHCKNKSFSLPESEEGLAHTHALLVLSFPASHIQKFDSCF